MIIFNNCRITSPDYSLGILYQLSVKDSKISQIIPQEDAQTPDPEHEVSVVDAQGLWLMPGLTDLHVHLREPGFEWKETIATGARAAIAGGYTTICAMPNTNPVADSVDTINFIKRKAEIADAARVLPIGAVSKGLKGSELTQLSRLFEAGCVAFSDDGEPIHNGGMMRRALEWCKQHDVVICCHEEDKCLSCSGSMHESPLAYELGIKPFSELAEEVMVARDIEIARATKGRVHICHVSTTRSVELIRRAKNDGIDITCEVTPHHLLLTEQAVAGFDPNYKMSPPLGTEETREALFAGLLDGTIDAVASDHAPHELKSKNTSFDAASFGILGLQTSLPLLLSFYRQKKISLTRLLEVLAEAPASIIRDQGRGRIAVGMFADLILLDPERSFTLDAENNQSKSFNSPFFGQELTGSVRSAYVGGVLKYNAND